MFLSTSRYVISGLPTATYPDTKFLTLHCRLARIGYASGTQQPQAWSAPLSRELLVFKSFIRSLSRSLRTLLEVTSLNMLLRGDARRARDDLLDITLSLPFQTEVNTGFGILAKVYLDALTHINGGQRVRDPNGPGIKDAKSMALEICEDTFTGIKYPRAEVERGFRFWDVVSTFIPLAIPTPRHHHRVCGRTRAGIGTAPLKLTCPRDII